MEALLALFIGVMAGAGVYLLLRARTFDVVLGMTLLSYAVNVFIFVTGRVAVNRSPIIDGRRAASLAQYADPLPQALVLTAIVISFAMTALLLVIALRARAETAERPCRLRGAGVAVCGGRRERAMTRIALDRRADRAAAAGRRAGAAGRATLPRVRRPPCRSCATLALAVIAVRLAVLADSGEVGAYLLGNWQAPFGIALALDRLAALMLVLTALVAVASVLYACGTRRARPAR